MNPFVNVRIKLFLKKHHSHHVKSCKIDKNEDPCDLYLGKKTKEKHMDPQKSNITVLAS